MIYKIIFLKRFKNHINDKISRIVVNTCVLFCIIMYISIYKVVYGGKQNWLGVPYCDLAAYLVISITLFNSSQMNGAKLAKLVVGGNMTFELLKPYSYALKAAIETAADFFVNLLLQVIPILFICGVTLRMRMPENAQSAILSSIALVIGVFIFIAIQLLVQMLVFWSDAVHNFIMLFEPVYYILGGVILPYWFMPRIMRKILMFTPLAYIWHMPMEIYVGNISVWKGCIVILLQLFWLVLLSLLIRKLFNVGRRSLQAAD